MLLRPYTVKCLSCLIHTGCASSRLCVIRETIPVGPSTTEPARRLLECKWWSWSGHPVCPAVRRPEIELPVNLQHVPTPLSHGTVAQLRWHTTVQCKYWHVLQHFTCMPSKKSRGTHHLLGE